MEQGVVEQRHILKDERGSKRRERFCFDCLLVRIHCVIVMIEWTGLAPWKFEFHFPGSLTFTFLWACHPTLIRGDISSFRIWQPKKLHKCYFIANITLLYRCFRGQVLKEKCIPPNGPRRGQNLVLTVLCVPYSLDSGDLLRINMQRFRGGLTVKAHRLLYHSILGSSVIKKTKKRERAQCVH